MISYRKKIVLGGVLFLLVACSGCGKNGAGRSTLSGKVTFGGQPIPYGTICFTPDSSKGNKGPQGFAKIVDGEYSTDKEGKGTVTGPIVVQIMGFSEKPDTGDEENSTPLFPRYETKIDLPEGTATKDFNVPADGAK